jgi:polyketide synthase PksN
MRQSIGTVSTRIDRGRHVPEPVAVVGMSGCFPQAEDVHALWENLASGRDCIGEIPRSRWGDAPEIDNWRAGVIDDVALFDPRFFGISPRVAEAMDPQQRLLMTYAWKVLEDGGYAPQSLSGSRTAIFVGTAASGYASRIAQAGRPVEGYSAIGHVASMGPNRMSHLLDLRGPSEPIETACSSGLVALHRGVQALRLGECDFAIVGGVNTLVDPATHVSFSKAGMLSPDGRCKAFSARADGYVRGEGACMLLLKRLSDAERDGDHICGLIRGTAQNHGGLATSLTAPNPRAQADVIKTALQQAGVDPGTIGYVEAHGTGTALGDPIELEGLRTAFAELSDGALPAGYCGLGSVKTNIGHLELAAGVAGVIKVLLQMRHHTLVKSLHCEEVNPYIPLRDSPFYVVRETRPWEPLFDAAGQPLPRRAGVSSFGFGGVNAHVVVEEYVPAARPSVGQQASGPRIVVLSAKHEDQLREQARQLLHVVRAHGFADADLADIAYTLQVGRDAMDVRLACAVRTVDELIARLESYVAGTTTSDGVHRGEVKRSRDAVSLFAWDEELRGLVAGWAANGKADRVAELWAKGLSIDWNQVYGAIKPRRVSLPTYPFARDRCWGLDATGGAESPRPDDATMAAPRDRADTTESMAWSSAPPAAAARTVPLVSLDNILEKVYAGDLNVEQAVGKLGPKPSAQSL